MRADVVVVNTFEGPCAVARGVCRVCGWSGVDAFDVGLRRVGADWEWDQDAEPACPRCGLHEVHLVQGVTPPLAHPPEHENG